MQLNNFNTAIYVVPLGERVGVFGPISCIHDFRLEWLMIFNSKFVYLLPVKPMPGALHSPRPFCHYKSDSKKTTLSRQKMGSQRSDLGHFFNAKMRKSSVKVSTD